MTAAFTGAVAPIPPPLDLLRLLRRAAQRHVDRIGRQFRQVEDHQDSRVLAPRLANRANHIISRAGRDSRERLDLQIAELDAVAFALQADEALLLAAVLELAGDRAVDPERQHLARAR